MSDNEIWRPIVIDNVNDYYEVSNYGNVRSKNMKSGNMTQITNKGGYFTIRLTKKEKKNKNNDLNIGVHRLVAIHFIENPENKPTVDHIDRNRSNNHVSNLRWANHSEQNANQNIRNRENLLQRKRVQQLDPKTGNVIATFESQTAAANAIGREKKMISTACKNPDKKLRSLDHRWRLEIDDPHFNVNGGLEATAAPGAIVAMSTDDLLDLLEDLTNDVNEVTLEDQSPQEPRLPQVVTEPEEWRRVVLPDGTVMDDSYMISNTGMIKIKSGKISPGQKDDNLRRFKFTIDGKLKSFGVHDLVASTFIRLPEKGEIIWHKNEDRSNNMVSNLEWITQSILQQNKIKKTSQSKKVRATFPDGTIKLYGSQGEASRDTGDNQSVISNLIHGKNKKTKSDIKYEFVQE